MQVFIMYSRPQLETAIKFISKNNETFRGQVDYIRASIMQTMKELALNPDQTSGGTMGYTIIADKEFEGIDTERNFCFMEILVDPALNHFNDEDDYVEEEING